VKPKLLIIELWGLGDLVIATPFIRAAAERHEVTLLAKPYALELQPRLWPGVKVAVFNAPWTSFTDKYQLWRWPWRELFRLRQVLAGEQFAVGLSARWDPRDHLLLQFFGARQRLGFPRLRSQGLLTRPLARPGPLAHHYEYWRTVGQALGIELPAREQLAMPAGNPASGVLIHSGARLPARVWPLEHCRQIVRRLREKNLRVQVACDPDQANWWRNHDEPAVACPRTVTELLALIDQAGRFIGNDSGPGHLAAFCGVPTLTIFGPQLPEWFAPLHPQAEWITGRACPYRPCSDYCRYATPRCITELTVDEVWPRLENFIAARPQPFQNKPC
jgi:ADP-heptose:LPS heptosyltransferase